MLWALRGAAAVLRGGGGGARLPASGRPGRPAQRGRRFYRRLLSRGGDNRTLALVVPAIHTVMGHSRAVQNGVPQDPRRNEGGGVPLRSASTTRIRPAEVSTRSFLVPLVVVARRSAVVTSSIASSGPAPAQRRRGRVRGRRWRAALRFGAGQADQRAADGIPPTGHSGEGQPLHGSSRRGAVPEHPAAAPRRSDRPCPTPARARRRCDGYPCRPDAI